MAPASSQSAATIVLRTCQISATDREETKTNP
jgi:hypothetical protein